MDTLQKLWHRFGNETLRRIPTTRKKKAESHFLASKRKNISLCCSKTEGIFEFSDSMVSNLPQNGQEGTLCQTNSRASLSTFGQTEGKVEATAFGRSETNRLFDRLMDGETNWPIGRKAIWRSLRLGWNSQTLDREFTVELPKAGTSSSPAERRSHRLLEAANMAEYKKTRESLGPIWSSLTKVDSSSFQMCVKHGRRAERLRFFDIVRSMIASRRSVRSAFRLNVNSWVFISSIIPRILREWKWFFFCEICCDICRGVWFCFGMEARFTDVRWLRSFLRAIQDCAFIVFLRTLRSLTQRNLFGRRLNMIYRIVRIQIHQNYTDIFENPFDGFTIHDRCYGLASMPLIFLGNKL